VHKYIHNVTKVMCASYVRCTLSVLQKECRKVWGARYTLDARYRLENTVIIRISEEKELLGRHRYRLEDNIKMEPKSVVRMLTGFIWLRIAFGDEPV